MIKENKQIDIWKDTVTGNDIFATLGQGISWTGKTKLWGDILNFKNVITDLQS